MTHSIGTSLLIWGMVQASLSTNESYIITLALLSVPASIHSSLLFN